MTADRDSTDPPEAAEPGAATASERVLTAIRARLRAVDATWRELEHAPTRTSEDSARERGEPLEIGGKAIVMKVDETFRLFVVSAARKLRSSAIKRHFSARKLRFASPPELLELTGLQPGSVPPFGHPILPLELWVDESTVANPRIAFNAGSLRRSIVVAVDDWVRAAQPVDVLAFSADSER